MPGVALRLALAAAVLSGAAALAYEVVWLRMLGLVVGHAVDALTAVLAAFMGGLALGAALFGRLAGRLRRPLAACAWLEGGVSAYAVLLPQALAAPHRGQPGDRLGRRRRHLAAAVLLLAAPAARRSRVSPGMGSRLGSRRRGGRRPTVGPRRWRIPGP